MSAKPQVLEFGMGVDVHGRDATKGGLSCGVGRHPAFEPALFTEVRERGGKMIVEVTVAVPDPASVDVRRGEARAAPW